MERSCLPDRKEAKASRESCEIDQILGFRNFRRNGEELTWNSEITPFENRSGVDSRLRL